MKADFANLGRYASENHKLHVPDPERIVFFGDSITEFWTPRNSSVFKNPHCINRGISGQTTSQMLLRFDQDVVQLRPKTVVILAGINDIAQNTGFISVPDIARNILDMAEKAFANQIEVALCSVLPSNNLHWRPDIDPTHKIIALNSLLSAYAAKHNLLYIDYYSHMVNTSGGLDTRYSDDGVHPNLNGYAKMEEIIRIVMSYEL